MKILIVCSHNYFGKSVPFIEEQVNSLKKYGHEIEYFPINRKGLFGYLKTYLELKKYFKKNRFDLIHAHYGLSGALACMQRDIPVITTYHGSDIHLLKNRLISYFAIFFSEANIFVSERIKINFMKKKAHVIPCGVDLDVFKPLEKELVRQELGMEHNDNIILFSSYFENQIKNSQLALEAIKLVPDTKLLELKNHSRTEINLLLNASDCLLMTSFAEGSPQLIKEALVTNCPIISTDVGDVADNIYGVRNCYIVGYDATEIAQTIKYILRYKVRTNGESKKELFSLENSSMKIDKLYKKTCRSKNNIVFTSA